MDYGVVLNVTGETMLMGEYKKQCAEEVVMVSCSEKVSACEEADARIRSAMSEKRTLG